MNEFTTEKMYDNIEKVLIKMNIFISNSIREISRLNTMIFWFKLVIFVMGIIILFFIYNLY